MHLIKSMALVLLASALAFAAEANPPLGLQLESFKIRLAADVPSGLDIVKSDGFTIVETAGTYKLTPEQFRAQLDAHGLKAVSSHFPYEGLQADLPGVIAAARALGSTNVVIAHIPHKGVFDAAMARKAAADFNSWGKALAAAGLRLLYHPHGYEFVPLPGGGTGFDILMNETDPKAVFFEMDVFWVVYAGQNPVALLAKYPDRWKMFHLKDVRIGAATGGSAGRAPIGDFVTIGTGQINWRAVLAEGRKIGIEYSFIEDESSDPVANVPPSVRYLESLAP
ncbi:MAG TPA: sugar phosphate isomerase/epimerase [Opitutaceae bacterium]